MATPITITARSIAEPVEIDGPDIDPNGLDTLRVGLVAYNWEADTSLALWNLVNFAAQHPLVAEHVSFDQYCQATPKSAIAEKDEMFRVLRWVREQQFDVVGFSCYIWNIRFVNQLAQAIKEIWPHIKIIYGGQQIRGFYEAYSREA